MRDESELQTQVNCDLEAYLENAASQMDKYESPVREAEEHLTSC